MAAIATPLVETLATHQRGEVWRADAAQSLEYPILFWITRGQGRVMVDCRMRGIGPNTAIFIPPNTLFSYEMMASPQGMVVTLPRDESAGFPRKPALLKASSVQMQGEISGLIDALARELSELRPGQRRAVMAYCMMIGVWLDRAITNQPQEQMGKSDRVLQKFSHVVSIGHRDGKSLGDFAADLQVTPTHLTRLTQNAIGKPASAILQERVITAACAALRDTDRPVQDIAEKLGFSSPAYFTRAFQTHTGKSPSAFRKDQKSA